MYSIDAKVPIVTLGIGYKLVFKMSQSTSMSMSMSRQQKF